LIDAVLRTNDPQAAVELVVAINTHIKSTLVRYYTLC